LLIKNIVELLLVYFVIAEKRSQNFSVVYSEGIVVSSLKIAGQLSSIILDKEHKKCIVISIIVGLNFAVVFKDKQT